MYQDYRRCAAGKAEAETGVEEGAAHETVGAADDLYHHDFLPAAFDGQADGVHHHQHHGGGQSQGEGRNQPFAQLDQGVQTAHPLHIQLNQIHPVRLRQAVFQGAQGNRVGLIRVYHDQRWQRVVRQGFQHLAEAGQGLEFCQRLFPGYDLGAGNVVEVLPVPGQLPLALLADVHVQKHGQVGIAVPAAGNGTGIVQQHRQTGGQGQGNGDHQDGHGTAGPGCVEPLQRIPERVLMVLTPAAETVLQGGAGTVRPGHPAHSLRLLATGLDRGGVSWPLVSCHGGPLRRRRGSGAPHAGSAGGGYSGRSGSDRGWRSARPRPPGRSP